MDTGADITTDGPSAPADAGVDEKADAAAASKFTLFYLDVGGRVMTGGDPENPVPRALVASAGQGPRRK